MGEKHDCYEILLNYNCNARCSFCSQGSFDKSANAKFPDVAKEIYLGKKKGYARLGLSGGEPLLRPDIFALMEYAKDKKLEVRLNTNCSLVNAANINKFKGIVDNILIPIESCSEAEEAKATGQKEALKKKVAAIRLFKKISVPTIRVARSPPLARLIIWKNCLILFWVCRWTSGNYTVRSLPAEISGN